MRFWSPDLFQDLVHVSHIAQYIYVIEGMIII